MDGNKGREEAYKLCMRVKYCKYSGRSDRIFLSASEPGKRVRRYYVGGTETSDRVYFK